MMTRNSNIVAIIQGEICHYHNYYHHHCPHNTHLRVPLSSLTAEMMPSRCPSSVCFRLPLSVLAPSRRDLSRYLSIFFSGVPSPVFQYSASYFPREKVSCYFAELVLERCCRLELNMQEFSVFGRRNADAAVKMLRMSIETNM